MGAPLRHSKHTRYLLLQPHVCDTMAARGGQWLEGWHSRASALAAAPCRAVLLVVLLVVAAAPPRGTQAFTQPDQREC